jgi:phosphoribosylglycinamide formyltransferase-1
MLNVAVFGSGRGSNFHAILDAIKGGRVPHTRIACVISNNPSAGILGVAQANSLPAYHLSQKQFGTEEEFVDRMRALLHEHDVNFIALAGYMKLLPLRIIADYRGRIVNIHPALLPKFGGRGMYGSHVHEAVLAAGETHSGATVHLVDEVYDHGTILLQKTVPVLKNDSVESLAARVLQVEHEIYPEAIRQFALGHWSVPANNTAAVHP